MSDTQHDTRPGERRGPRWTIGQFSRMTRLTARMLRHYDRLGLLRPGEVDPRSGYRYYSRDELEPAVMLLRLREAGLGLDDIGRVLPALLAEDEMVWRPVLEQHLSRLGAEAEELGRRRERTLALLDHRGEQTMSIRSVRATIETIPAHVIVARREIIPTYDDEGALFSDFFPQVREVLEAGAARLTGAPCGATFFEEGHVDHDVDIEVWEVIDAPVRVGSPLSCRTVGERTVISTEHAGPYAGISEAYTLLVREIGERGLTNEGPSFERYFVGPVHNPDAAAWRTQICFPIAC